MYSTKTEVSIVIPVYKPGPHEVEAVSNLLGEVEGFELITEITIVNDSSEPLCHAYASSISDSEICRVLDCGANYGRSIAINKGVQASTKPIVWVLDADCWPGKSCIRVLSRIDWKEVDVYIGVVDFCGSDKFWRRYQSERRESNGTVSTANMLIKRNHFLAIDGFCKGYKWYGFEDIDFLERLPEDTRMVVDRSFRIKHNSDISLDIVRKKMVQAAYSGKYFSTRFPAKYSEMAYSRIDYEYISYLRRCFLNILSHVEKLTTPVINKIVHSRQGVYRVSATLVLFVSAMSYYKGTKTRTKSKTIFSS